VPLQLLPPRMNSALPLLCGLVSECYEATKFGPLEATEGICGDLLAAPAVLPSQ
jgi:hypothetical protein